MLVDILKALITPTIGGIAVYIAYQQYQTNKRRELRESRQARLSVYRRVKKFLNYVDSNGEITKDVYNELLEAIAEADFLFPEELTDWLSDLQGNADEYWNIQENIEEVKTKSKEADLGKQLEYLEKERYKEIDQLQSGHCELKERFNKYIKFA